MAPWRPEYDDKLFPLLARPPAVAQQHPQNNDAQLAPQLYGSLNEIHPLEKMTIETSRSCSAAQRNTSPSGETRRTHPSVGPSSPTLVRNTHEITTEFESLDSPWDAGPSFCYWPLQILDCAREETPQPVPWTVDFRPEKSSDPGVSPFVSQNTSREDSSPPVRPADTLNTSTQDWKDQEIVNPFQQEGYTYSEAEFPSHLLHSSPDLTYESALLEAERSIDPYDPRSWSPASTATLSPMLGNQRPPSPRRGLESPPASPPTAASQPNGWNCPECGKHFHERVLLRKHVRYHVQPYNCPTCKKGFSFTKDLRRHQQTRGHGGEDVKELLSCNFEGCGFKFKACRSDTYKRHCRLVHEAKPEKYSARRKIGERRNGEMSSKGPNKSSLRLSSSEIVFSIVL